jgi:hypothetical protein
MLKHNLEASIDVIIAGIMSILVSLLGLGMFAFGYDPRKFRVLTLVFCLLPTLEFPAFFVWFASRRRSIQLLWLLCSINYIVLVINNWQECLAGRCIADTGFLTVAFGSVFSGPHVIGSAIVAVLMQIAYNLRRNEQEHTQS